MTRCACGRTLPIHDHAAGGCIPLDVMAGLDVQAAFYGRRALAPARPPRRLLARLRAALTPARPTNQDARVARALRGSTWTQLGPAAQRRAGYGALLARERLAAEGLAIVEVEE